MDLELTLEFLEPMLELLDRLVLMLQLLDRLEYLLMESLACSKLPKGKLMELVCIALCLIAGDLLAIASARIPVPFPSVATRTIAGSATDPVASSTITFIISFRVMRFLLTTAAAAIVVLVALVLV